MRNPSSPDIHPLRVADADAARSLVLAALAGTRYSELLLAWLSVAHEGRGAEASALVARRGSEVVGIAIHGEVGGAQGAGKLYGVALEADAQQHGVGERLCEAACADLAARGARFVLAELSDEPSTAPLRELFRRSGFSEAGAVADYFADGVALVFLRRELSPGR